MSPEEKEAIMRKVRRLKDGRTGIVCGERTGKLFVLIDGDDASETRSGWVAVESLEFI